MEGGVVGVLRLKNEKWRNEEKWLSTIVIYAWFGSDKLKCMFFYSVSRIHAEQKWEIRRTCKRHGRGENFIITIPFWVSVMCVS